MLDGDEEAAFAAIVRPLRAEMAAVSARLTPPAPAGRRDPVWVSRVFARRLIVVLAVGFVLLVGWRSATATPPPVTSSPAVVSQAAVWAEAFNAAAGQDVAAAATSAMRSPKLFGAQGPEVVAGVPGRFVAPASRVAPYSYGQLPAAAVAVSWLVDGWGGHVALSSVSASARTGSVCVEVAVDEDGARVSEPVAGVASDAGRCASGTAG